MASPLWVFEVLSWPLSFRHSRRSCIKFIQWVVVDICLRTRAAWHWYLVQTNLHGSYPRYIHRPDRLLSWQSMGESTSSRRQIRSSMERTGWTRHTTTVDSNHLFLQLRTLESQRTRYLRHHCYICLQCCSNYHGLCSSRSLLWYTTQRNYRHLSSHLHRPLWLRTLRNISSHYGMASRIRILEYATHRKNPARSSLARFKTLQASQILLVRIWQYVRVWVSPSIYFPLVEFCFYSMLGSYACDRQQGSCTYKFVWRCDE